MYDQYSVLHRLHSRPDDATKWFQEEECKLSNVNFKTVNTYVLTLQLGKSQPGDIAASAGL